MKKFTSKDFDNLFSQMSHKDTNNFYTVFDRRVKDVPVIEVNKLADIPNPIEIEQIYRLSVLPPVEVISMLSKAYSSGDHEVGIVAVKDHLFLAISCLSTPDAIMLPSSLKPIIREKLFQLDFHSHPVNVVTKGIDEKDYSNDWTGNISLEDLTFLNNTINGSLGIGEFNGLISLTKPSKPLPNGVMYDSLKFDNSSLEKEKEKIGEALRCYNVSKGKGHIKAEDYPMENLYLRRDFLIDFFGYRFIPWENKIEIELWFQNQMNLIASL